MTITYATHSPESGLPANRFTCTHDDPSCSAGAVVLMIKGGVWLADALCAEHAPKSALTCRRTAQSWRRSCPTGPPPPAATEGQGAVSASPAPAPGGPPVWRLVCADGSCLAVFSDRDAAVRTGEHVDARHCCGPHTVEPCE